MLSLAADPPQKRFMRREIYKRATRGYVKELGIRSEELGIKNAVPGIKPPFARPVFLFLIPHSSFSKRRARRGNVQWEQ